MRGPTRVVAGLAAAVMLLGGCTGIPDSSSPQTVAPVRGDGDSSDATIAPQRNAGPRTIVSDFLTANVSEPGRHASARSFLTPTARNQWSDQRVTVISDIQLKTYDPVTQMLDVTGRVVGSINADGIYEPSLQGSGNGGRPTSFPFKLVQIDGQYRIDQLRSGLLITDEQFSDNYVQHVIYFYDLAEKYLVPDVRWSSISASDGSRLETWLVDQLVSTPRPELQDVVSTDTFPAQADASRLFIKVGGSSTRVEIPGSSQLERDVRDKLAAQLAQTLAEVQSGSITITDGGVPVQIPAVGGTSFTDADFPGVTGPDTPPQHVYYLDDGRVKDENGKSLGGQLSNGSFLTSIAIAQRSTSGSLSVAATRGSGPAQQLAIGTQSSGLRDTGVRGELSRPVWAPGLSEVWVASGPTIHRVTVSAKSTQDSVVQLPPTAGGGRIVSLQFSPDGSQIDLVVAGSPPSAQLYVGAVVRDGGTVRIGGLEPISPAGVVVTDAGWNNSLKLTVTGYLQSTGDANVYETGVDGSIWNARGLGGLPAPPDNIAVSTFGTWTESDNQVWELSDGSWISPSPTDQAFGHKPTYQA